jgi:sugar/nucleoside kinase (ribokinase family)
MSRVVVLGDVMVDVVVQLEGPLAHASDAPARIAFHGGGSAANTAAWLAAAGARPVFVGRVGEDDAGRAAAAALQAAGVEARLARDRERPTGTCIVLIGPDGERTMIPDAGANDGLAAGDLPAELLARGDHLHVGGYALLRPGSRGAASAAIRAAAGLGMGVSVDPSSAALLSPDFLSAALGATLLLPNALEARALTGEPDVRSAARALARRFAEVVVTLGADGALWTNGSLEERVPAQPVAAVVDLTGAGDAFAAGLLAARLGGSGTRAALDAGCRLAARAVTTSGGRPDSGQG